MTKNYIFSIRALFLLSFSFFSCSEDEQETYQEIPTAPETAVTVNIGEAPHSKLSEYHFFEGALKNQTPALGVVPYEPASPLFSDYAHKKRFVWMPKNTKAIYNGDDNVFEFPLGSVLIKTFYYTNVLPNNSTKIIETRLLIRKSDGWKAYDYIWNNEQTEATLDTEQQGVFVPIEWSENGITKSVNYKIPSQTECLTCHKINPNQSIGGEMTIPIGPKPQNLNTNYSYNEGVKNQIAKWKEVGYLDTTTPTPINSTVNWEDTSKSLEMRARSYIDINCAHCHRTGGHCDYVDMRLNYSNLDLNRFGVCLTPLFTVENGPYVIFAANADRSEMILRLNTTEEALMMPIIGRSIIHDEGVALMKEWINSLPRSCN